MMKVLPDGARRLTIRGEEITFSGVDMGNSKPMTIIAQTDTTITIKIPGGKHWYANHEPWVSHSGTYEVFEVLRAETTPEGSHRLIVKPITSFDLRPGAVAYRQMDGYPKELVNA